MALRKAIIVAVAGAIAALALVVPSSPAAPSKAARCPTFRVLHNDKIGAVVLPAGTYNINPRGRNMNCSKAASLFTRFLEDYDGILPHQWRAIPKGNGKAVFRRPGRRFSVALQGGLGGAPSTSRLGHLCPGNFHVLHNDRIGPLFFPAGYYQLYIPRHAILGCGKAANKFASFLQRPDGSLPKGWKSLPNRAVFYRAINPRQRRFRVDPGT